MDANAFLSSVQWTVVIQTRTRSTDLFPGKSYGPPMRPRCSIIEHATPSRARSPYTAMDGNGLALQVWLHGKQLHFAGSRHRTASSHLAKLDVNLIVKR